MRYRTLDANGDYVFGHGPGEFLVNSSAAVAQAVLTDLLLHRGEWFLDTTIGMPWETQVLGYGTQSLYDSAIKTEVLGVQGVLAILSYSSSLNRVTRQLTVSMTISTVYGTATLTNVGIGIVAGAGFGLQAYGGPGMYGG